VIKANTTKVDKALKRPIKKATHHLSDHLGGFWRPDLGVFVVPAKAVTLLNPPKEEEKKTPKKKPLRPVRS
jgi:hypothetical protein